LHIEDLSMPAYRQRAIDILGHALLLYDLTLRAVGVDDAPPMPVVVGQPPTWDNGLNLIQAMLRMHRAEMMMGRRLTSVQVDGNPMWIRRVDGASSGYSFGSLNGEIDVNMRVCGVKIEEVGLEPAVPAEPGAASPGAIYPSPLSSPSRGDPQIKPAVT